MVPFVGRLAEINTALYTLCMELRFLHFTFATAICLLCMVTLCSCKTRADIEAAEQADLRIAALTRQVETDNEGLNTAYSQIYHLNETIAALHSRITELEEKDTKTQANLKEISEQKAKLEHLLAEVQTLQLSAIISSIEPVQVPASASAPAQKANPARSTSGDTRDTPISSVDAQPSSTYSSSFQPQRTSSSQIEAPTSATPSLLRWPHPTELNVENTLINNRTERKKIPGTPLFSERDTSNGINYYYHNDFWYKSLGPHIEIAQFTHAEWASRLVIETSMLKSTSGKNTALSFLIPSKDGAPEQPIASFGPPDDSINLNGLEKPAASFCYNLSPSRLRDLSRALENPGTLWRLTGTGDAGASSVDEGSLSGKVRMAIIEMLAAINDLTSNSDI